MNFENLYTFVTDIIARPELESHIRLHCIQAVRSAHSLACFPRDLEIITVPNEDITFTSSDNSTGQFALGSEVRIFNFMQALNSAGEVQGSPLQLCSLTELHKRKLMREDFDTCYLSGNSISFKASASVGSGMAIAAYVYRPPLSLLTTVDGSMQTLTDAGILAYHNWFMDGHEGALLDFTMQYVCSAIGETKLANYYRAIWKDMHLESILNLADIQGN